MFGECEHGTADIFAGDLLVNPSPRISLVSVRYTVAEQYPPLMLLRVRRLRDLQFLLLSTKVIHHHNVLAEKGYASGGKEGNANAFPCIAATAADSISF